MNSIFKGLKVKIDDENGGQKTIKYSKSQVVDVAYNAADAITLNGFSSIEELNKLLVINCHNSRVIINQALKELSYRYNERATKESELVYTDIDKKDAHIANTVLMNNKLKIIADVRSFIATQSATDIGALPVYDRAQEEYIGNNPSILEFASREPAEEEIISYKRL